jgi:hypothetical protein
LKSDRAARFSYPRAHDFSSKRAPTHLPGAARGVRGVTDLQSINDSRGVNAGI